MTPGGTGSSGFSLSFAPRRAGPGNARQGGDRPGHCLDYVPGIGQPPSTYSLTTCDLMSHDRTDLRDRDEKAGRSDASFRRIGARPRQPGGSREGILQRILRRCQNDYGRDAKSLDCRGRVRRSSILVCRRRLPVRRVTGQTRAPVGSADGRSACGCHAWRAGAVSGCWAWALASALAGGSADPYSGRRVAGQEGLVCRHEHAAKFWK